MKKILASFLMAVVSVAAFAQTNAPTVLAATRPLSLADCLAAAVAHNFDVQVARYEPQISLFNLNVAYAGYDPNFFISGSHAHDNAGAVGATDFISDANRFNSSLGGLTPWGMTYGLSGTVSENYGSGADSSGGSAGVNVTQPLLRNFWIDGTRTSIAVAKNRLKISEQALRQQLIATVTDTENAYNELIYARENLSVQQQGLDLARQQFDDDQKRVNLGSMAQLDVQQDESQVASRRAALISAQFNLAVAENTLKNLITDNYAQWHDVDIVPSEPMNIAAQVSDVQSSWSRGLAQRPDVIESRLNLQNQGIELKYLRNQVWPELDLIGSYGVNGAGREFQNTFGQEQAGNRPFYSYGAQLSIPLGNSRARNNLKSGRVTEKQLLLGLKKLEQNVMVQIDNAVKSARSSWEGAEASKQARIFAEAALDAEQKKYAVGKSTTFTVLRLQNDLTSARSAEIRAQVNYVKSLAVLAAEEGSTLERRKMDLLLK
jgi:outer membrane protein TolC